jgi:RNA polymerase-binding transcription factor
MTDARYTQLKQLLEEHRRHLQQSLSVRLRDVRAHNSHDGKVVDALDAAEASASDLEQDFGIALAEMAGRALSHVDRALARLASRRYGSCVDCNETISHKRLTALPFALRCRECEELRESDERRSRRLSAAGTHAVASYDADPQRVGAHDRE